MDEFPQDKSAHLPTRDSWFCRLLPSGLAASDLQNADDEQQHGAAPLSLTLAGTCTPNPRRKNLEIRGPTLP